MTIHDRARPRRRSVPRTPPALATLAATLFLAACSDPTGPVGGVAGFASEGAAPGGSGAGATTTDPGSCDGTLGAITVEEVNVPDGATCVLQGTRVEGNVFVRTGSSLQTAGVHIDGNVQAEDAARVHTRAGTFVGGDIQVKRGGVRVEDTTIDGNLQVEEGAASLEAAHATIGGDLQLKKAGSGVIRASRIGGNVQLEENGGSLSASDNEVGADFQVVQNRGGVTLVENRIHQALQCQENRPAPTGGGNVAGEKEGQCVSL